MKSDPIRVGIVDDHAGVRAGIKRLLASAQDIVVVGEGENGIEAIELVERHSPDILLLDVELPLMRGDEVVRKLRERSSQVKVIAVSSYDDRMYIQGMLKNGASGYITKEEAPLKLVDAIRSVAEGIAKWISPRAFRSAIERPEEPTLTGREADILQGLAAGKSVEELCAEFGIESKYIEGHLRLLAQKMGVGSLEELTEIARRMYPPPR